MKTTPALLAALIAFLPCPGGAAPAGPKSALKRAAKDVQAVLGRLDRSLDAAERSLAKEGLTGAEARKVLAELCQANPEVVDCAAVDAAGRMVTIAPAAYASYEGADISGQEQVARLHASRKPVLSRAFRAVEGYEAVDLEHPVQGPDGRLLGSVSMLIKPEVLLGGLLGPLSAKTGWKFKVLQEDGLTLYSSDRGPGPAEKEAHWTTVGLHGTRWRLAVFRAAP